MFDADLLESHWPDSQTRAAALTYIKSRTKTENYNPGGTFNICIWGKKNLLKWEACSKKLWDDWENILSVIFKEGQSGFFSAW